MNHHELKIWPVHYFNVRSGTKTFEIRKNDRAFQKGDKVKLRYFNPDPGAGGYCSNFEELDFEIGDVYPIDAERVVFSLLTQKETK